MGDRTGKGTQKMKTYLTPTDALIDHLKWLHSKGEFNSVELAQKMKDAGVPKDDQISESLFRMLRNNMTKRLADHRAAAACRVLGIQVAVINPHIPEGWKAPKA